MADCTNLTVGEVLKGIAETKKAVARADELLARASAAGAASPSALGALAESTFKMRDHLEQDLADLNAALEKLGADGLLCDWWRPNRFC